MAYTTISKSSEHFNTKLYTGTGSAPNAQTGVGFRPDFIWLKPRNLANSNRLHSSVLTDTDYFLISENADQEATNNNCITSFDTDGFTLGNTDAGWNGSYNYVTWNWKAGGGAGSSNTDGSTNTTTTTVNTTAGFSMSTYTGTGSNTSIGHGLGTVPHWIMCKRLNATGFDWFVYHKSLGQGKFIVLDSGNAEQSSTSIWQNTTPTSSVITLGSDGGVNASGGTYICYAFAEKDGYSKFGTYTGNGNSNGPFIYTGFKPAFLLIKNRSASEYWYIMDVERPGYNTNNYYLKPNDYAVEGTSTSLATSLLSNGFKIDNSDTSMNTNGQNYMYMAFAEAPLVGSNNIPVNAR